MGREPKGVAARRALALFGAGTVAGLSDGQLLERFATRAGEGAELAFAALVERHGPMVLRTCRSILGNGHDPQDAFQATFLILVRRGGSLWVRDSLGPWLHRVACRVAVRARQGEARRRAAEREAAESSGRSARPPGRGDGADWLHEEIDRLPERYRGAVVICDLEGYTYEKAAQHLGCPVGTVKSRLARARERLRDRLSRRGLAQPGGPIAGLLPAATAPAPMPASLVESTTRAALALGSGKAGAAVAPATVEILIEEVSKSMIMSKTRWIAAALLAGGIATTGTALVARQEPGKPAPASAQAPAKEDEATLREREAAFKRRSIDNLKTIALALYDYHDAHQAFPPAVLKPPGGGPPYSWRVAVLPDMGQQELYNQYKFDEPWDGPNNRKLLDKIPAAFRAPGDKEGSTDASYFALTGPGAIFSGAKGTDFKSIRDGMASTILAVESRKAVPWTKPEDILFNAEDPLPDLGGYYGTDATKGAFYVSFADGSVRLISGDLGDVALRALISKAGGEDVRLP